MKKEKAQVGELIGVCPGGKHAWYQSNMGKIRKPVASTVCCNGTKHSAPDRHKCACGHDHPCDGGEKA